MTQETELRDIIVGLLQRFWMKKPYIREAGHAFVRNITLDLIKDLEQTPDVNQNTLLLKILTALQGEQTKNALNPLREALVKVDYWTPASGSEVGPVKVLGEDILDLLRAFGPSALPILLDAYVDDSDFNTQLAKVHKVESYPGFQNPVKSLERGFSQRALLLSYKVIKNQRLRDEIERHGHIALEKIEERLRGLSSGPIFEKLQPLYEKLKENYSLDSKMGYKLLL